MYQYFPKNTGGKKKINMIIKNGDQFIYGFCMNSLFQKNK